MILTLSKYSLIANSTFVFAKVIIFIIALASNNLKSQCSNDAIYYEGVGTYVGSSGVAGTPSEADGLSDGNITGILAGSDNLVLSYSFHNTIMVSGEICISLGFNRSNGVVEFDDGSNIYSFTNNVDGTGSDVSSDVQEFCFDYSANGTVNITITENGNGSIKVDGSRFNYCLPIDSIPSLDSDGDGIINSADVAPLNPCTADGVFGGSEPGGFVYQNSNDCDNDGVAFTADADDDDPCNPYTFGLSCDTDNDGVSNFYDNCSNTPNGSPVDIHGCPSGNDCLSSPDTTSFYFNPRAIWSSIAVDSRETPLVGDVTGDGSPNVIVDDYGNNIYVLNGVTGAIEYTITLPGTNPLNQNNSCNAIGDVNGNGYGEIFALNKDNTWFRCDFNGSTWTVTSSSSASSSLAANNTYVPGLADFDEDGTVELYAGTQIWNTDFAGVGDEIIVDAGIVLGDLGGSMAMDILPDNFCTYCAGKELIAGGRVFSVDIASKTITQEVYLSSLNTGLIDGFATSIADMDLDGDLDVIYTSSINANNESFIFVWEGQSDSIMYTEKIVDFSGGVSRVNIADFDGDERLEMGVHYANNSGGGEYKVIDDLLSDTLPSVLWSFQTTDVSGKTGSTVFDFLGDGSAEIVYRDHGLLRILDGKTGNTIFSTVCRSSTRWEYPVVVDVNNDGNTNIICTCDSKGITAYESSNKPWAPSRKVWNQHGYHITNVNNDLTIPSVEINSMSNSSGKLNNFLVQSFNLGGNGDIEEETIPDAEITNISYTDNCPTSLDINVTVLNSGDNTLSDNTKVVVYDGDPESISANVLTSLTLGLTLPAGNSTILTSSLSCPVSINNDIYAIINISPNLSSPFLISDELPVTNISECDYSNNKAMTAFTLPIDLLSFEVIKVEQSSHLFWSTASEENNAYFLIEHSLNLNKWTIIDSVTGSGTSNTMINYQSVHKTVYQGKNYYRIKQFDYNGDFKIYPYKSVNFTSELETMIYPNPTKTYLTIHNMPSFKEKIYVYNSLGQEQKNISFSNQNDYELIMNVNNLSSGIYFIKINNKTLMFKKE